MMFCTSQYSEPAYFKAIRNDGKRLKQSSVKEFQKKKKTFREQQLACRWT